MPTVETVKGPVDVHHLGRTLMHEHVFVVSAEHVDNHGADVWWDEEEQVHRAVQRLSSLARTGISTIVDPTVWGLGRNIPRLQRIADLVDLHIIVATGIYAYEELPHHYAYRGPGLLHDIPEPMVDDFVRDIEVGVAGTGVRAAFLKCCVPTAHPTLGVVRIVRAVARAHLSTGVPVMVHTSGGERSGATAADLLAAEGVDLQNVIIAHAGDSNDLDYLVGLADRGAVLGMDRFGLDVYNAEESRVATVAALACRGYADRMVLSHDASCFIDYFGADHDAVRAAAVPNWHYEHIGAVIVPALLAAGVTAGQIDQMMAGNPRRVFGG
ncbi:phosphotriesterase [Micromonospora sp. NPDC093277]|uniref:phosphotriesterase family protein n=1 Tax=Micromonospora sp. NPDC093277 TaxID=3364291 RepID=UPI003819A279